MARGWESKSVESQMESAREEKPAGATVRPDQDREAEREKQNLLLSRAYVQHQMESATHPAYADSLRQALDEIERKLAGLDGRK